MNVGPGFSASFHPFIRSLSEIKNVLVALSPDDFLEPDSSCLSTVSKDSLMKML